MSVNTKKAAKGKLFENFILTGLLAYISYWTIPDLIKQYSFWRDEIFTAAFISASWAEMFNDWIGPDVHPPLYFVITKVWAAAFGTSELSLRGVSYLTSIGTIILLWNDWRKNKRLQRLIAMLIVTSSPTFLYYSQEARSYSLILFLSCWLLIRIFEHRYEAKSVSNKTKLSPVFTYAICIALSLTHYFGFILSLFILLFDIWSNSICKRRFYSAIVAGIICIWPVFHVGYLGNFGANQQELTSNLSNSFEPVVTTLMAYIYSNAYFAHSGIKALNLLIGIILLASTACFLWANKSKRTTISMQTLYDFRYSLAIILVIMTFLVIADLKSPITTARNCIILLYPTSILLGSIFESLILSRFIKKAGINFIKLASIGSVSIIVLLSSKISINNINLKANPGVNYKGLAEFVKTEKLCIDTCITLDYDPEGTDFGATIDDYYFGDLKLIGQNKPNIKTDSFRLMPIIGSYKNQEEIAMLSKQYPERTLITSCSENAKPNQATPFVLTGEDYELDKSRTLCIEK